MDDYPVPLSGHELSRPDPPLFRWRPPQFPVGGSLHCTIKFNLPKALLDDPDAAAAHARTIAAEEADRFVRDLIATGKLD